MGAKGLAKVLALKPCPEIQAGSGHVVLSTFAHPATHEILDVTIGRGEDAETIGVAATHPFWSVQDQAFVPIGHLVAGSQRGPLTARGVRNLCDKYSAFRGFKIHPHLLRHMMAHQFVADNSNDLVSFTQILGHESLNTSARYTLRSQQQLGEAADNLSY